MALTSPNDTTQDRLQCPNGRVPGACGVGARGADDKGWKTPAPIGVSPLSIAYADANGAGGGSNAPAPPSSKTYKLPDPEKNWSKDKWRVPQISKLPLYLDGQDPNYDQVLQQGIPNCYLAATLAALANTGPGRKQIKAMIKPNTGPITTICHAHDSDNNEEPEKRLQSDRWFTVTFAKQSFDVSDVLYHDDSARNYNLRYMTTPKSDRAIWGSIIEAGYASLKKGYDNMTATKGTTLNIFLDEFSATKWTFLVPGKDDAEIKSACANAKTRAALIATKADLPSEDVLMMYHGYAVLGMSGSTVKLYDPDFGSIHDITIPELIKRIQALTVVT